MHEIQIDIVAEEDITQFQDTEHVSVDKINHEFVQEDRLKGQINEYTIFNDIHCYQSVQKKHGGKIKFRVNLSYLDPQPHREFILSKSWMITAASSFVLGLLVIYLGWFSPLQFTDHTILSIVTASILTFSVIAFLVALMRTHDRILFHSRYGQIPVLEFFNKKPDADSFEEFIHRLSRYIGLAQQVCKYDTHKCLTLELQELRRLKQENVISEQQYEQGKQVIFKNKAFKA
ncbi:MAG: hypothetical protein QNJ69_00455 [Gammaproteobacteria bacterium]|nr:hypothetical protein [Gammaproteobacteria bacterium]